MPVASQQSTRRRTVRGDGLDLAVWEQGDAEHPTVVLVHGYPDTHQVWDGVAADLAADHHVVTYDVRGAGASGQPREREGYDLAHLMADLEAVITAVSPDGPVHLVGHDWGSIQGWEAVTHELLVGRIAGFTSMSGPGLDHVAAWMRRRAKLEWSSLRPLLRQGVRSWYTAFFQIPGVPELGWRTFVPRGFGRYLQRVEGIPVGVRPAATLARDGANGVDLYRQNLRRRMADPQPRRTEVPVLLIVATRDRFVTPGLLSDTADHASDLRKVDVDAGHWFPAVEPARFADLVRGHIADVDSRRD